MADNIRMDSHKLLFHPQRVSQWLNGENIYPIEMEIGLTGGCNHRCIFCAIDYMGYNPVMIDKNVLLDNLKQMSIKGLKSVVYAGEGEPLVNKNAVEIFNRTKDYGIDVAMSTNGVLFTKDILNECLNSFSWVRYSVSAIREETYDSIHRGKKGDLKKVLINLEEAVRVKRDNNLKTTLGVQLLLLPQNKDEVVEMAKEMRKIGVDYFAIKPFSYHPQSGNKIEIDYQNLLSIEQELKDLKTEKYNIFFRANAMKKIQCNRNYDKCYALPFMVYMDAKGNIWPCIVFMGKDELKYGNINEQSFVEIWEGENRKKIIKYFDEMDINKNCRELCRLDEMNRYLHELVNPGDHVNFI